MGRPKKIQQEDTIKRIDILEDRDAYDQVAGYFKNASLTFNKLRLPTVKRSAAIEYTTHLWLHLRAKQEKRSIESLVNEILNDYRVSRDPEGLVFFMGNPQENQVSLDKIQKQYDKMRAKINKAPAKKKEIE